MRTTLSLSQRTICRQCISNRKNRRSVLICSPHNSRGAQCRMTGGQIDIKMASKSSINLSTRIRRRNFSFRKMLCPRSACQVLSNLLGHLPFKEIAQCERIRHSQTDPVFIASIKYDGQSFESYAESKLAAENDCSEKVLMYITAKTFQEEVKVEEGESNIPWVSLASLALFNMFRDWERQGFILPRSISRNQNELPKAPSMAQIQPKKEHVESFGVAKGFGHKQTVKLLPRDEFDGDTIFDKYANKLLRNIKGIPKAPFETEIRHPAPKEQANTYKFPHPDFPLKPIQISPTTRCKTPESMPLSSPSPPISSSSSPISPSPSLLAVPKFESGLKHPVTLLHDLAGPRLVFREVSQK